MSASQAGATIPEGLVSLSTLAGQLGFLPPTPAWPEVRRALERLERSRAVGTPYPDATEDAHTVASYWAMLGPQRVLLTRLLVAGRALGRMVPLLASFSEGEKLLRGLQAIAWARGFRSVQLFELAELAWSWVRRVVPALSQSLVELDPTLTLEQWAEALEGRLAEVEQIVQPDQALVESARADAFFAWQNRLTRFLGGSAEERPPTGEDLLCRVAEEIPSTLFKPDPATMTLADWSGVAVNAVPNVSQPGQVPDWAVRASLQMLGFAVRQELAIPPRTWPEEPSIVIVPTATNSITNGWNVSDGAALLVAPAGTLALSPVVPASVLYEALPASRRVTVAFELGQDGAPGGGPWLPVPPTILYFSGPGVAFGVPPLEPFFTVKSLDDLIRAARRAIVEPPVERPVNPKARPGRKKKK